ncbi:outer membrane beta-barrel family protein [Winogradskyella flava]|uniref:outer membrane beta-barrel family protein n=1 Tax=Winogradskyella flava TaxID=1884876 RepID=UPI0024929DBC|nr:outer membrane beta-barrel family protein [Winogradskyella flava]
MKSIIISTLVLFTFFKPLEAQISGSVVDKEGLPIPYANVMLKDRTSNTILSGTITDEDGIFNLEFSEIGAYILKVDLLSYKSWESTAFNISSISFRKQFKPIVLEEEITQLEGVVVTARKRLIERTSEGNVINVKESVLTKGSNVLQVLERSPGVILDRRNNSFSLNGKEGTLVMINGKAQRIPVADLMILLNSMSADNLEKIELLTNPSARHDVDGNAGIINIVLSKNEALGLRSSIVLSGGYGEGPKQTSSVSVNYGSEKSLVYGSYSFSYNESSSGWRGEGITDLPVLGGNTEINFTSNMQPIDRNHNINFGYEYQLSQSSIIGASLLFNQSRPLTLTNNRGLYNFVSEPFLDAQIEVKGRGTRNNLSSSLFFEKKNKIKKNESTLSVTADYINYNSDRPNSVISDYFDENGIPYQPNGEVYNRGNRGFNNTTINLGVLGVNYNRIINEKLSFESGLKGSYSETINDARIEIQEGNDFIEDERFISKNSTKETIGAIYALSDYSFSDQLKAQIGLRYEHWNQDFSDNSLDRSFGKLFPSLFLTYNLSEAKALNLAFTKRITRPNYIDLASFLIYNGPTSVFSGNPQLLPAITDNITFTYSNKSFNLSLVATNEKNPIARFQITRNPQSTVAVIAPANLDYQRSLDLQSNIPWKINDWWNINFNSTIGRREFKLLHTDEKVTHSYIHYNFNASQTMQFTNDFSLELSGWYTSKHYNGSVVVDGFGTLNGGIKKTFKNGSSLQFSVSDILQSFDIRSEIGSLTREAFGDEFIVNYSSESRRSRIYNLSFTYPFGNNKVKDTNTRSGADSEKSRI